MSKGNENAKKIGEGLRELLNNENEAQVKFNKIYSNFFDKMSRCPNCGEKIRGYGIIDIEICEHCGYDYNIYSFKDYNTLWDKTTLQISELFKEYGLSIPIETIKEKILSDLIKKFGEMGYFEE